jgi:hypothetical protein
MNIHTTDFDKSTIENPVDFAHDFTEMEIQFKDGKPFRIYLGKSKDGWVDMEFVFEALAVPSSDNSPTV